ncbi:dihydrofolate reductase [Salinicoccus roseus]|jgi:dihydrofolate reductase|uniref:dihydrofolate reductase n=1 Tax=Salinicoccus roseus TaxID=45670 RepID=UPI000F509C39|nr:dihydrofolate reductase [Salinicoccus roseus]RPE54062.1 dihydrofolate reductase [Salinicoccus roseus]GGA68635.1 dihydrofolate reductase [Salinicoccus roseus]
MVSLIVCHAEQNVIGFKNKMPWHLPNDLKHVKKLTQGNTIVMGRKTFDSLGRPLPNRRNVVLTRNRDFDAEGIDVIHEVADIKELEGEVFIFGGSGVYNQTMDLVDEMHITRIHETFGGDTFFPEYDESEWELVSSEEGIIDDKNRYPHEFLHFRRRTH